MEGYPSLVKGAVLKTVRSFAARGFEPHTFLITNKGVVMPMSNTYEKWAKEQQDKTKRLIKLKETQMATPNKHISGKWTKEQRDKAKALLQSWLRTHQKGNNQ